MPAVTACNSQETCEVSVTHENLQLGGDPCPDKSYSKYLFVSFTCISKCIFLDLKYLGCRKITFLDFCFNTQTRWIALAYVPVGNSRFILDFCTFYKQKNNCFPWNSFEEKINVVFMSLQKFHWTSLFWNRSHKWESGLWRWHGDRVLSWTRGNTSSRRSVWKKQ